MATSRKAPDLVLDTSPQLGGNLDVNGHTVDGVDIATRDGVLTSTTTTANNALPKAGGAMTGAITTNSTFDGVDIATRDGVLTSTTTTANNALPKAGGAMTGAITTNSTFDGRDVATDGSKLDLIEASADVTDTANVVAALSAGTGVTISGAGVVAVSAVALTTVQTAVSQAAQLALTAQEGDVVVRSDENKSYVHNGGTAGTMADYTLLATPTDAVLSVNGVTGAVTAAHIAAAVEAASGSNTFTDADHTKLNAIEASADVTDTTNVTAAGALMDGEVTNLAQVKAFDTTDYATAAQGTTANAALPKAGGAMTGAITTNSTFDGRDVATDGSKLDGIESGATADQTNAEIKTAYEANADTNEFSDAEQTKLAGIATSANNYVHPNHSGDVTSTADGATVISSGAVDIAMLSATGTASGTTFLRGDNTWVVPTDTNTTYTSSDFTHDDLTGFVANEHVDWTTDQGATNIHAGNYTDTNTTYSVGDGGLTQKNFTTTLKDKLDGIATGATANGTVTGSGTTSGTNTGDNTVCTSGTATTAATLATARTIAGVSFDGSANISLNNNAITNGAGYTTNVGDITGVTAGTGMSGGGTSGTVTLNCTIDSPSEVGLGNLSSSGNALSGTFTATGDIVAYSDERLKENVEVIPDALSKVKQLSGYTFTRNDLDDTTKRYTGVIAQEVLTVLPEAVVLGDTSEDTMSVAYGNMMGLMIEAIKELEAKVEKLENE